MVKLLQKMLILFLLLCLLHCCSGYSTGTKNAAVTNETLRNYTQNMPTSSQRILPRLGTRLIISEGFDHSEHLHPARFAPSTRSLASSSFPNSGDSNGVSEIEDRPSSSSTRTSPDMQLTDLGESHGGNWRNILHHFLSFGLSFCAQHPAKKKKTTKMMMKEKKRRSISSEASDPVSDNGIERLSQTAGNFRRSGLQTEPSCIIPKTPGFVCHEKQKKFPSKRIRMTLGPYLQCPDKAEKVKRKCLNHILEQQGYKEEDTKKYWQELLTIRPMLRACYTSELGMDDNTLLETLFLDASYIYCILYLHYLNPKPENKMDVELLAHDLLHLENQIPFKVVEIINFIFKRSKDKAAAAEDLGVKTAVSFKSYLGQFIDEKAYDESNVPKEFRHLLHLAQLLLKPSEITVHNHKKEKRNPVKGLYSAKYCYDQGVTFKVRRLEQGSACSILDVLFSWGGLLHMPALTVNPTNLCMLRNFIEFEQIGGNGGQHVTEYVELLTVLLQEEEDVQLLSSKGIIIRSSAHTNTEVKNMIKELGELIPYLSEESYLEPIYQSLDKYCSNTWKWSMWKWSVLFWRKVKSLVYEPWFIFSIMVTGILGLLSYFKK